MTPTKLSEPSAEFASENLPRGMTPMPPVSRKELTLELCEVICNHVRRDGVSDEAAGALAGIPSTTLARWKEEYDLLALGLKTARAMFERALMREIRDARKREGTADWRALAWLLQHTSSRGIVTPAQKAKIAAEEAAVDAQKCANLPESPKTAPMPPTNSARENATNPPETPAARSVNPARANTTNLPESPAGARPLPPPGVKPGNEAAAASNTTKVPETPKPQPGREGAHKMAA